MNVKSFLLLGLSILLVGCSQSSDTPQPAPVVPSLGSLTGGTLRLKTTDNPILVESQTIYTDDGNLIADGVQFNLVADTVKISIDNSNWVSSLSVSTINGKFKFYLQSYNLVGLYRINAFPISNESVKFAQGINSRFFVDISPGDPNSIGEMFADRFEDLSPYDNIKNSNESWIVSDNPDLISYIGIGPVRDVYNNIISEGSINLSVDSGTITSENPTQILSGYAYFAYKPDGVNGNLNILAQLIHPSNVALSINQVIKKATPELVFLDQADFSNMMVNETKCFSLRLKNQGSMAGTYLEMDSLTPFQLLDENTDDPLCSITTDTCKLRQDLRTEEICKLRVKFTMPSTPVTDGELVARVKPSEFPSSISIMPLRTQVVQAAQLVASNTFISFGGTQCSATRNIEMYVQNVGDFDATNIIIENPPPFTNQSQPFFSITSPVADLNPSPNLNTVINCGTTFPAHRKCRILVSFNPTASVPNQALSGRINSDNTNPLLITMSGYTIPGVAVGGFPISFITPNNSILPLGMGIQAGQRSTVNVGPVVDACSSIVSDGTIVNASVTGGNLTSNVGVTNNGLVSFIWNSVSDVNLIGNQTISITTGSQLAQAFLQFRGIALSLSGNTNLGEVIQEKPRTEIYTLNNNGNQIAQNLSISGSSPFVILDKGSCSTDSLGAGSSCQITVQAAPQNLNQDLIAILSASSNSIGVNQASISVAIKARTKAILSFDSSRYLFNDGSNSSTFTRTITLTNNGPATSNLTQVVVDSPFTIQSSNCPSTFSPNTSCQVTIALSSSQIANVGGKKVYVINEIDNGTPFADLAFSELKFTNSEMKTLIGRCAGPFFLAVNGQSGAVAPSTNVVVDIGSSGGSADGLYYSTSNCSGSPITQTTIASGNSQSNAFYFKSLISGTITLLAQNSNFPTTGQNLQSRAEITLDQTLGLVNNEIYPLLPSGGFGSYVVTFSDNTLSSTYATLTEILDDNNNPSGTRNLNIKNTLTSHQTVTIKVLDVEGFSKNFIIDLYPPVVGGSLTVTGNDPVLVPYTDYGNLNTKTLELKHYDSGTSSYVSGSLYGSTLSAGYYSAGSNVPSGTVEYVFVTIAKYTGGSSVAIVPITVNLEWPFGTLGDLIINSGQTVNLSAGSTYDYNNITINSGGTLNITGVGTIVLGARGNVVINGTISSSYNYNNGNSHSFYDPFTKGTISLTQSQASGGSGGRGGVAAVSGSMTYDFSTGLQCIYTIYQLDTNAYACLFTSNSGGSGGSGSAGCGGGGGGGGGFNSGGGAGGSGCGNGFVGDAQGGAGNSTLGNGGNGIAAANDGAGQGGAGGGSGGGGGGDSSGQYDGGGGGGGGRKGGHSNSLYLRTKGTISGTGIINLNGQAGYNGGAGNSGSRLLPTYNSVGGMLSSLMNTGTAGGGGGGAGGSGGSIYLYSKGTNTFSLSNILNNGGSGGSGGGRIYSSYPSPNSANGSSGSSGFSGNRIFSTY